MTDIMSKINRGIYDAGTHLTPEECTMLSNYITNILMDKMELKDNIKDLEFEFNFLERNIENKDDKIKELEKEIEMLKKINDNLKVRIDKERGLRNI